MSLVQYLEYSHHVIGFFMTRALLMHAKRFWAIFQSVKPLLIKAWSLDEDVSLPPCSQQVKHKTESSTT